MSGDGPYNGWRNKETWNVALWINNDSGLYRIAKECEDYPAFAHFLREENMLETPDHVAWNDSGLDVDALSEVIRETRGC